MKNKMETKEECEKCKSTDLSGYGVAGWDFFTCRNCGYQWAEEYTTKSKITSDNENADHFDMWNRIWIKSMAMCRSYRNWQNKEKQGSIKSFSKIKKELHDEVMKIIQESKKKAKYMP